MNNLCDRPAFLRLPGELVIDCLYYVLGGSSSISTNDCLPVVFVGFDAIPGFIFVRDMQGFVWRCLREDLYCVPPMAE